MAFGALGRRVAAGAWPLRGCGRAGKRTWPSRSRRHGHGSIRRTPTTQAPSCSTFAQSKGRGFMRIAGTWYKCDDGGIRPVLVLKVHAVNGTAAEDRFLIDIGADRTVFCAALLSRLGGPTSPAPTGVCLTGVGGPQPFVQVDAALQLTRNDGGVATIRGMFAAFTDPAATDLSVLGRDVLNHFDLILSRRRDEIALLAGVHRYEIHSS